MANRVGVAEARLDMADLPVGMPVDVADSMTAIMLNPCGMDIVAKVPAVAADVRAVCSPIVVAATAAMAMAVVGTVSACPAVAAVADRLVEWEWDVVAWVAAA